MLIIGASGGVGTYTVHLAKAFGAWVTSVCSTTKMDIVRSIGANHVIDYTCANFAESEQRYDLILDIGGNSSLARRRHALVPQGALITIGGEGRGRWFGGTDRQLRALVLSPFVGHKLRTFISTENHEDLIVLKELIESGKVTPVIDKTCPLSEAPEPSGIWKKDTLKEKSLSPCEARKRWALCPQAWCRQYTSWESNQLVSACAGSTIFLG